MLRPDIFSLLCHRKHFAPRLYFQEILTANMRFSVIATLLTAALAVAVTPRASRPGYEGDDGGYGGDGGNFGGDGDNFAIYKGNGGSYGGDGGDNRGYGPPRGGGYQPCSHGGDFDKKAICCPEDPLGLVLHACTRRTSATLPTQRLLKLTQRSAARNPRSPQEFQALCGTTKPTCCFTGSVVSNSWLGG